jgi:DNA-binding LytR/AlgR family response regulator
MLEIALCDDDPSITGFLETTLKASGRPLGEELHIQAFHQGAAVLAVLQEAARNQKAPFDIIFLDIELGDTTGIAVAEQIRKAFAAPILVFVSAHESYCKQLFQFDTTAFLSKPVDGAEVQALFLRIYQKLRNPKAVFTYSIKEEECWIPLADILLFESRAHKIEIVTKDGVKTFYGKLDEVEAQLMNPGFVRTHHSMLVNLAHVERFEKSTLFLPGGRILPLARNRQKEAGRKIRNYIRGVLPPPPQMEIRHELFRQHALRNTAGAVNHRRMVCSVLPAPQTRRKTAMRSITVKFPRRLPDMAADPLKHHKY